LQSLNLSKYTPPSCNSMIYYGIKIWSCLYPFQSTPPLYRLFL
jgi:hypothetical protein